MGFLEEVYAPLSERSCLSFVCPCLVSPALSSPPVSCVPTPSSLLPVMADGCRGAQLSAPSVRLLQGPSRWSLLLSYIFFFSSWNKIFISIFGRESSCYVMTWKQPARRQADGSVEEKLSVQHKRGEDVTQRAMLAAAACSGGSSKVSPQELN